MRLYGRNSVIERLRCNPSSIKKILLQRGVKGFSNIQKRAVQKNVPVFTVTPLKMQKISRGKNAQGIMTEVDDFSYAAYDDLLEQALEKNRCPIFMDGITDPQNLGAIIRGVACLGKFSVVLPTHDSVSITESVLRVASGGDNYVPVSRVPNLIKAIRKAQSSGFRVAGTVVEGGSPLDKIDWPHPLALVIGSEDKGIREITKKHVDLCITIPMSVETLSFNVAQAASIICYEITRHKKEYKEKTYPRG